MAELRGEERQLVYPDILLTMWDIWQEAAFLSRSGKSHYSFPETYLRRFEWCFRSRTKKEEDLDLEDLNGREGFRNRDKDEKLELSHGQKEQLEDLKAFCFSIKKSCCGPFVSPDDVYNWLSDLMRKSPRETIELFRSKSYLVNEIRRFYSRTRNPVGNELSGKLRKALRALVSEDKVKAGVYDPGTGKFVESSVDGQIQNELWFRTRRPGSMIPRRT